MIIGRLSAARRHHRSGTLTKSFVFWVKDLMSRIAKKYFNELRYATRRKRLTLMEYIVKSRADN